MSYTSIGFIPPSSAHPELAKQQAEAAKRQADEAGFFSGLFGGLKTIGGGLKTGLTEYGKAVSSRPVAAPLPPSGAPSWLLPVGIGAGVLLVAVVLLKKKRQP